MHTSPDCCRSGTVFFWILGLMNHLFLVSAEPSVVSTLCALGCSAVGVLVIIAGVHLFCFRLTLVLTCCP